MGYIFGFISFLFTLLLNKWGSFPEPVCCDTNLRSSLVISLLLRILSNTWSQQPGLWVFMEVKRTDENVRVRAHTHTQAYKCNHTHPSVNIFPPKEMAHLSWHIPNRLTSLLKKLSVQGLAWDLVWSSCGGNWPCLACPKGFAGKRQSGQPSSVYYWDGCTAPPLIMDNPLVRLWGWWHWKWLWGERGGK